MSDGENIRAKAEGASSVFLNARQARSLAALLDAFDTEDDDNPASLQIWANTNPDLTVTVHAAVHWAPEGEIYVCVDEEGSFYGYEESSDTIRWLVPIRRLESEVTRAYPYRGGLICYRSEDPDPSGVSSECSGGQS